MLFACTAFAQEKKYQSLLWEISGNGLAKKSYLYGSMHVSDKVSYHLSDAFFNHLLEADMVANESEPSTWMDLYGVLTADNYYRNNFYTEFYLTPLEKDDLYPLFRTNNFTLNNLLFRTNEQQKEYQEETYLDMFIYRTGKKYNKKTVGLEDTKASIIGVMSADLSNMRPKEENITALQKILKNNAYEEVMINFYRDKDLDMIDSLTVLSASENYLKALLYDRNVIMTKSIDSLAQKGSLFAAVGAAHLPGKKGIIEMLRKKGYTVTPIFDNYTDKGKAKKQEIEEYFVKPTYKIRSTQDGMIHLPLFPSVIESGENLESPDLANGGYINVKRVPLLDFLKKDNKRFNPKTLDSLFYENIPGKILDKKSYTANGYPVYDIKNITKTGNSQRYKYYITPLEIIVVSMAGEEDYVRRFEDDVFNNISLKPLTTEWKTVSPKRGGFNAQMPSYNITYGDGVNTKTVNNIDVYAYDDREDANYFLLERTLTENRDLENSAFELKRIQYEFYNQFDIDSTDTELQESPLSFISSSKIGNKAVRLKTVLKGAKYYILGAVGASPENSDRFFNSFKTESPVFTEEFRTFKDSIASFTIDIPTAQNEKLDFNVKKPIRGRDEKVNEFSEKIRSFTFTLPTGQTIDLLYFNSHKYDTSISPDSLWAGFKKSIVGDKETEGDEDFITTEYSYMEEGLFPGSGKRGSISSSWPKIMNTYLGTQTDFKFVNEDITYNSEKKYQQADVLAVSKNSEQAIKYRAVFKNGETYVINTLVERDYKNTDPYIEKVFNSFTLLDNPNTIDSSDRFKAFLEDARSEHDSIRYSALNSVGNVTITKENLEELEQFINTFEFKPEETDALRSLYEKIGELKDPRIVPFLEQQYKDTDSNTTVQFSVLRALSYQKSKNAYKKIMELMEYDLPLSANGFEIISLFTYFKSDIENSEVIFPDVLQFYSINEYHAPIVEFTAALIDHQAIKPKKLKSYTKMILTNAKLELKRVKSRSNSIESAYDEDDFYGTGNQTEELISYIELLYPFKNEKDVKEFYSNVKKLNLDDINLEFARLDIINGHIEKEPIQRLLENSQTRFVTYNMLYKKHPELIKEVTEEQVAESGIVMLYSLNIEDNSVTLLEKKTVPFNGQSVTFYFYKIKNTDTESYGPSARIAGIAFINSEDNKINPIAYKRLNALRITDDEKTAQTIKSMIDATLNEGHSRASFSKMEDDYDLPYDYDY